MLQSNVEGGKREMKGWSRSNKTRVRDWLREYSTTLARTGRLIRMQTRYWRIDQVFGPCPAVRMPGNVVMKDTQQTPSGPLARLLVSIDLLGDLGESSEVRSACGSPPNRAPIIPMHPPRTFALKASSLSCTALRLPAEPWVTAPKRVPL